MDEFFNKKRYDRCGAPLDGGFTMSRFNTDALCHRCLDEERQHPDYQLGGGRRTRRGALRQPQLQGHRPARQNQEGETMNTPKTDIRVRLTGEDGNIFFILGRVREALRRGGRLDLVPEMTAAVTSSRSYEDALARIMEYVIVA